MAYDNEPGVRFVRHAIEPAEQLDISETEKKKIFHENARHLLRLPV
jgi:predicted TIM-barrel fold metal-dependent hydrolase